MGGSSRHSIDTPLKIEVYMKIVIGPDHFEHAKKQAHQLRDKLISESVFDSLKSLHTKASFLNTWASILGYNGWGDFQAQTKFAHKDSSNNVIISPETIEELAKELCKKSYFQEDDVGLFEDTLFLCSYEHEKNLFHEDDAKFYSKIIGSKDFPITLELGPSDHQVHLVDYLFNTHSMTVDSKHLDKELLKYAKDKRKEIKNASKDDFVHMNLDIYPKSGTNTFEVISNGIKEKWIETYIDYSGNEPKEIYRLSSRAINWMFVMWTEDYGEEWLSWNRAIDTLISQSSYENLMGNKFSRVKSYINDESPEKFYETFCHIPNVNSDRSWENDSRQKEVAEKILCDIDNYQFQENVFHVTPRLLLDYSEIESCKIKNLSVSIIIEFIDKDNTIIEKKVINEHELIIKKPYPNQRHVTAQSTSGHIGRYLKIPLNTTEINCHYTWRDSGDNISIDHHINHPLIKIKGNSLYSAFHTQNFNRVLGKGKSAPYSFFLLNAVSGSAENLEKLQTTNRFDNQLYGFERKNGVTSIDEVFPIEAGGLHYDW
jgi:hypothetical protein